MPCQNDDFPYDDLRRLRQSNDDLAAQLCNARKILYLWRETLLATPTALHDDLQQHLQAHAIHREKDRERAIGAVDKQIAQLAERMTKIRELGGAPTKSLTDELAELQSRRNVLLCSDPLATELY